MILHAVTSLISIWRGKRDPVRFMRAQGMEIGDECRLIGFEPAMFGSEPYLIRIGNHVTISHRARFITHDGGVHVFRKEHPDIDVVAPISVGNNVFIGANAIVMPGVSIEDNAVIGAGAVVTRDVLSNTVVAGVPARHLMSLEEYWQKVQPKATFVRSLPFAEKRRLWKQ